MIRDCATLARVVPLPRCTARIVDCEWIPLGLGTGNPYACGMRYSLSRGIAAEPGAGERVAR